MTNIYDNTLKKKICVAVCLEGKSTIKQAKYYDIPIKTIEKWITAFNKDNSCFDSDNTPDDFRLLGNIKSNQVPDYDSMSSEELKREIMRKDIEIARLKKGYVVKGGGSEQKVYTTFCKKNTK